MAKSKSTRRQSYGPDFLVIGPHKTGTTWLFHQLQLQEAIQTTPFKEYHYLTRIPGAVNFPPNDPFFEWVANTVTARKKLFYRGKIKMGICEALAYFHQRPSIKRYANIFPKHDNKIVGEFAPETYMINRETIEGLRNEFPNIKLIIGLRDPVANDWSFTKMIRRLERKHNQDTDSGIMTHNQREVIINNRLKEKILTCNGGVSLFQHLSKWVDVFSRENIMFYDFNNIRNDPDYILDSIESFLGISISTRENLHIKINHDSSNLSIDQDFREKLIEKHTEDVKVFISSNKLQEWNHLFKQWLDNWKQLKANKE